ncbi:MAG: sigma 54-interacting transcriptional regulator [Myxococcales bacterium]|nr:sigma 54-interacting transcriptional regulator [Myxococcales bacterium]
MDGPSESELRLLFDLSQALDAAPSLREVLEPVLERLTVTKRFDWATLTLLDRSTGDVAIDVASGLLDEERRRGVWKKGEGRTGEVLKTGEPIAIERIADDPKFTNKTGVGMRFREASFVCVPIKVDGELVGTLGGGRGQGPSRSVQDDLHVLTIVASMVAQAVRLRQLLLEERRAELSEVRTIARPENLIGTSKTMERVYEMVGQVAPSDATVLLRGESGVGKELVAHAIHYGSPRRGKAFIRVNCAALSPTLLESELFGHERGAFTGALNRRLGRFELAHGGTIFLDEIGDFPPATQVALLRVIQEREFERVGGAETVKVDVRIIAATNRDLESAMRDGAFREDLYYRLNVFPIHVPALRQRKTDIPLLADYFIEKYSAKKGRPVRRISTPAIDMLMKYHWPGNVRELENCIERAVLISTDEVIRGHHLPPTLQTADESGTTFAGTLQDALDATERELLVDALKNARGNMAAASRALGITERIMALRCKRYTLDWRGFRAPR